jgi:hypothetical protein
VREVRRITKWRGVVPFCCPITIFGSGDCPSKAKRVANREILIERNEAILAHARSCAFGLAFLAPAAR